MKFKQYLKNITYVLIFTLFISNISYLATAYADTNSNIKTVSENGITYTILEDNDNFRIVETNNNNKNIRSTYDKVNNTLTTLDYYNMKTYFIDLNKISEEQFLLKTTPFNRGVIEPDPWATIASRYINSPSTSFCYGYTIQKNRNTNAKIMQLQRRGLYTGWLSYGNLTNYLDSWEIGVNAMYYDHVSLVASVPAGGILAILSAMASNPLTAVAAAVIALGFGSNVAQKAWQVCKDRDNLDTIYNQIYR